MITPIKVQEAKVALGLYLDDAGITAPADRYRALNRQIARTWLDMLKSVGLANTLDVFDVMAAKDEMIVDLFWQIPTGGGKSQPATMLTTEVQP